MNVEHVFADDHTSNSYHRALTDSMVRALDLAGVDPLDTDVDHYLTLSEAGFSPAQVAAAADDAIRRYRQPGSAGNPDDPNPDSPTAWGWFWTFAGAAAALLMALAIATMAEAAWTSHNATRIEEGGT